MKFADRMKRLGTETAFAVSAEAATLAAQGKKIYPLHLGDMNIKTPDNIIETAYRAMKDGKEETPESELSVVPPLTARVRFSKSCDPAVRTSAQRCCSDDAPGAVVCFACSGRCCFRCFGVGSLS